MIIGKFSEEEKKIVSQMRNENKSKKEIAEALNCSLNRVKSYLKGKKALLINYGTTICKVCGNEFEKKAANQEKCSDECRKQFYNKKYNNKRYCKKCGNELEKGKNVYCAKCREVKYKKVCPRCGEVFYSENLGKKYCSAECRYKPIQTKTCPYCGKEFTTRIEDQTYCTLKCYNQITSKSHADYMKELIEAHQGTIVPTEMYKGSDNELECVCLKCGNKIKKIARFYIGKTKGGCNKCSIKSHGEDKVLQYMKDKGYEYTRQYTIEEVKYKKVLLFDFAILNDNGVVALIEYDGEQHFRPVKIFGGTKQYKKQIEKDNIKNIYCIENNIPLIRIPYTVENIEQYLGNELEKLIS